MYINISGPTTTIWPPSSIMKIASRMVRGSKEEKSPSTLTRIRRATSRVSFSFLKGMGGLGRRPLTAVVLWNACRKLRTKTFRCRWWISLGMGMGDWLVQALKSVHEVEKCLLADGLHFLYILCWIGLFGF